MAKHVLSASEQEYGYLKEKVCLGLLMQLMNLME